MSAVESLDHQAALSRSLEDFSAISPAMQRVVRGYHGGGGQDAVVNGTGSMATAGVGGGGFDCSVFSPHPSPTVESRPHRSSSCDTLVGPLSNGASNPSQASSATETRHRGDAAVAQQQSVVAGVDRTLAALFAVGIAVVLAIIFILLGHDSNFTATDSGPDLELDFACGGQC